jgi:UDP-glucose 4-epimerase
MSEGPLVLVTGGAGFIGSHTVDALVARGCRVVIIDDLSTGYMANIAQWCGGTRDDDRVIFDKADITIDLAGRLKEITAATGPLDYIVHFAAQTAVPISVDDPAEDIRINLGGTAQVLEYARRHGVKKVVFASSSAVYDDDAPVPVSERSPARPASPYGISKLSAEIYLDYYMRYFGVKYTALRFMNVYGPRQDPKSHYSGVISIFMDKAVANAPITIFDDGEQTRDFVYVTDVAQAVAGACLDGLADGEIVNIGTGTEVTINLIAKTILDLAQSTSIIHHAPPRAGDIRRSVTAMDKAVRLLKFDPKVDLREGLEHTLAWVKAEATAPKPRQGR